MITQRKNRGHYPTLFSECGLLVLPLEPTSMAVFETMAMSTARRIKGQYTNTPGTEYVDLYQKALKSASIEDALH